MARTKRVGNVAKGGGPRTRISTLGDDATADENYKKLLATRSGETKSGILGGGWLESVAESLPLAGTAFKALSAADSIKTKVEGGEDNSHMGPMIEATGKLFDVISRGQYASAAGSHAMNDPQQEGGKNWYQKLMDSELLDSAINAVPNIGAANMVLDTATDALEGTGQKGSTLWQMLQGPAGVKKAGIANLGGGLISDAVDATQGDFSPAYLTGVGKGLAGKDKRSYTMNQRSDMGVENPLLRGTQGVALDVVMDPLSYVGTDIAKGATKGELIKDILKESPLATPHEIETLWKPLLNSEVTKPIAKGWTKPSALQEEFSNLIKLGPDDIDKFDNLPFADLQQAVNEAYPTASFEIANRDAGKQLLREARQVPSLSDPATMVPPHIRAQEIRAAAGQAGERLEGDISRGILDVDSSPLRQNGKIAREKPTSLPKGVQGPVEPQWPVVPNSAAVKQKGELVFKIAGQDVARSQGMYDAGRRVAQKMFMKNEEEGRWLYKAFSNQAALPDGLDQMLRTADASHIKVLDRELRGFANFFRKIPDNLMEEITMGIDEGKSLGHIDLTKFVPESDIKTGDDLADLLRGKFAEYHSTEAAHGLSRPEVLNYTYRRTLDPKDLKGQKMAKELADVAPGDTAKTFKYTLRQLNERGVKMDMNIGNTTSQRMAEMTRFAQKQEFNEAAKLRFGTKVGDPKVTKNVIEDLNMKRIGDTWYPGHIADALEGTDNMFHKADSVAADALQKFDKVMSHYKWFLTQANPGHHIRNLMGDIMMNFQDGVVDPGVYRKALRVVTSSKAEEQGKFLETLSRARQVGPLLPNESAKTISIGGEAVPVEKVMDLFSHGGATPGFTSADLTNISKTLQTDKIPVGSRVKSAMNAGGEMREEFVRMAHFIDAVEKGGKGKKLFVNGHWTDEAMEVARDAGQKVRKWNIDYGNLTPFEQKVMRRAIPFYSFMRGNIPRQAELLFSKPGFMALYPKGQNLIQNIQDTDGADDTLIPEWIRQSPNFRIKAEGQKRSAAMKVIGKLMGASDDGDALQFVDSGFTPISQVDMLNPLFQADPLKGFAHDAVGMSNPVAQSLFELGSGRENFTGKEINGDYWKYFMGKTPLGRNAYNANSAATGGDVSGSSAAGGFTRWLTGAPIRAITEENKQAEFKRREDIVRASFDKTMRDKLRPSQLLLDRNIQNEIYKAQQ